MSIDIAELLHPLSESAPCGEDISYSDLYDRIREARRADDPSLSQGEWQTELKSADWRAVIEMSAAVLKSQSKDLQAAAWLGEAAIARHGHIAAADACELLDGLLERFWEGLFPWADGGDLEERASRLAWFDQYAARALRLAPLNSGEPPMSLADWQSSREVDNLARQNRDAWQAALDEGKPDGETFDRILLASGRDAIAASLAAIEQAQAAQQRLASRVDSLFGRQAPGLSGIAQTLEQARLVMAKAAQSLGLAPASPAAAELASSEPANPTTPAPAMGSRPAAPAAHAMTNKQEALRQLQEIAEFFRHSEPHSPVAYLLDRAVAWADMPLDQWLSEVIDDDGMLGRIRERIGVAR